jgi:hypothetical protein
MKKSDTDLIDLAYKILEVSMHVCIKRNFKYIAIATKLQRKTSINATI